MYVHVSEEEQKACASCTMGLPAALDAQEEDCKLCSSGGTVRGTRSGTERSWGNQAHFCSDSGILTKAVTILPSVRLCIRDITCGLIKRCLKDKRQALKSPSFQMSTGLYKQAVF